MMEKSNVLIVEDSLIFAEGLELLLKEEKFIDSIHFANQVEKIMALLDKVEVVILDLNFDTEAFNGFSISKKIRRLYPKVKILVLTEHVRVFVYEKLFNECDVHAYLDKQLGFENVVKALKAILKGEIYVDSNIKMMMQVGEQMKISKREKQILPYLIDGCTSKQIGEKLFISKKTVEKHVQNIGKKQGVKKTVPIIVNYLKYIFANRENSEGGIDPFNS